MFVTTLTRQGWEVRTISYQLKPLPGYLRISPSPRQLSPLLWCWRNSLFGFPPVGTGLTPTGYWLGAWAELRAGRTPLLGSSLDTICFVVFLPRRYQSHSQPQPCRRNRDLRIWLGTLDVTVNWPPPYQCYYMKSLQLWHHESWIMVTDFQRCTRDNKDAFITIVVVGIGVAFTMWSAIICYICYSRKLYARYLGFITSITSATEYRYGY